MKDVEAQLIHDMQNTAVVLREAAGQLRDHGAEMPPAMAAHLAEMLVRRSDMLVRLLGDLSTSHLAQQGALGLSLQSVRLDEICQEVLAERHTTTGVEISVDVPRDATVVADPLRVTQVVDNLVTNALRYGGPHVAITAARDGASVRLSVSDDGPGVPAALVDDLFEAYVRGTASSGLGGSGLGLLIVRQLCEAMSGTIAYDGTDGARFTATLPALQHPRTALTRDVAEAGHPVIFWEHDEALAESLLTYVLNGLAGGEAVVVAATRDHLDLLKTLLTPLGVDADAVIKSGQLILLDAQSLHDDLARGGHIDPARFDSLIATRVRAVQQRWQHFRVFGEIVDLYWREPDEQGLAVELEACWNALRREIAFPLLCGYELAPGESIGPITDCHDSVVWG